MGPLETPGWSNRARNSVRQAVRVRPRRVISGTGQVRAVVMSCSAAALPGGPVGVGVRGHQVLGDDPGGGHFVVRVAGQQRREELAALLDGEPVRAAAQQPAGPEQRVLGEAAVPEGVLLGAAADLVDAGQGQFHDMEGIKHPDRLRVAARRARWRTRGTDRARRSRSGRGSSRPGRRATRTGQCRSGLRRRPAGVRAGPG